MEAVSSRGRHSSSSGPGRALLPPTRGHLDHAVAEVVRRQVFVGAADEVHDPSGRTVAKPGDVIAVLVLGIDDVLKPSVGFKRQSPECRWGGVVLAHVQLRVWRKSAEGRLGPSRTPG